MEGGRPRSKTKNASVSALRTFRSLRVLTLFEVPLVELFEVGSQFRFRNGVRVGHIMPTNSRTKKSRYITAFTRITGR
jgi:hypothetical protein